MVPSNISDNGRRLTEPQEIANVFNKYFVNVATDNQSSIRYSKNDFYDFLPPININVYVYVYLCVHMCMIIFPIILPIIFWPVVFLKSFLLYKILLKIFLQITNVQLNLDLEQITSIKWLTMKWYRKLTCILWTWYN